MSKAANERKKRQKEQRRQWQLQEPIDTVDQAVDYLMARLDQAMLGHLQTIPEGDALYEAYRELGLLIRNHFGLWQQQNVNLLRACGGEHLFADDASMVIIKALIRRLRSG